MIPKYAELSVAIVIFLFIFFALFLFSYRKGHSLTKNILGFLFLALGLAVADVYLITTETYERYPQYAYIFNSFPLLYGPLLWLLTLSVTIPQYTIRKKDWLHLLPWMLFTLSSVFFYHIQDFDYKREFLDHANNTRATENLLISSILLSSILAYIFFCYRRMQRYRKKIREEQSNIDHINLGWLEHTLLGFTGIIGLSVMIQIVIAAFGEHYLFDILLVVTLFGMLLFIMSSIIRGLNSDVLIGEYVLEKAPPEKVAPSLATHKGTAKSNLSEANQKNLEKLKRYMDQSEAFLNPALNLKDLAKAVESSPRALSTLINQGAGQSFFDFINVYRIRYAQDKIRNTTDEKMTILEVMYASGFNSKSSFNTAFKKHAGVTPTQWKKQKANG